MGIIRAANKIAKQVQEIFNLSFDTEYNVVAFENLGFDGVSLQRLGADNMAVKITVSGTNKYIGLAAPGTAQATEKWQAFKIDTASGTIITFADGNADFDNAATDLTGLSYS